MLSIIQTKCLSKFYSIDKISLDKISIDCGASSAYMHSRKDAIEMWNRRNENEKI